MSGRSIYSGGCRVPDDFRLAASLCNDVYFVIYLEGQKICLAKQISVWKCKNLFGGPYSVFLGKCRKIEICLSIPAGP